MTTSPMRTHAVPHFVGIEESMDNGFGLNKAAAMNNVK